MCKLPGYISANIHISNDKKAITNYAQWANIEAFNDMQQNEEAQKDMKEAGSIAISFSPVIYSKVWTHGNEATSFVINHPL